MALKLTVGQVMDLVPYVKTSLQKHGLMDAAGNFVKASALIEAEEIAAVAGDVEDALKADGLVVPPNVDKAIHIIVAVLPTVVQLANV